MNVPFLSVAMITLNEERHLPALFRRLQFADEIVVVDGGSLDATRRIAAAAGARVMSQPFDTFAAQRNRAIDACRGQWVLSIDADERPTERAIAEIIQRTREEHFDAFQVPIRSRIFGRPFRYCGTQDDRPVRLFRRGQARWIGDVHEVLRVDGPVGLLRHGLEHETLPDLAEFLRKMDRYTSLAAADRVAAGRRPRRRDAWLAPWLEIGRRLIWKRGLLDGPQGWAFCLLSGLSQWVLADKHRRLWRESTKTGEVRDAVYERGKPSAVSSQRSAKTGEEDPRQMQEVSPHASHHAFESFLPAPA